MKKIIFVLLIAVIVMSPLGASFASAQELGFFGKPKTAHEAGVNRGTETNPFAPCAYDFCIDPCELSDCGCDSYFFGCTCDWGCYQPPCSYDCVDPISGNTGENQNNNDQSNTNTNINNIIIENYIIGYDYRDSSRDASPYVNRAPVFTSIPVTSASVGVAYSYQAVAIDDTTYLRYTLLTGPSGMTLDSFDGFIRWVPTRTQAGLAYPVVITASDGVYETAQQFEVFVAPIRAIAVAEKEDPVGRVAGVATAEAAERNALRTYNIRVDTDSEGNTIVSWDTNRPTRGRVLFGRASQADRNGTDFTGVNQYEFTIEDTLAAATSHQVVLGKLEADRVYYFRTVSFIGTDSVISSERSFVQLAAGGRDFSEGGFASVIGTFGSFAGSSWFLLFAIIVVVLILVFRRERGEVEVHSSSGHSSPAAH